MMPGATSIGRWPRARAARLQSWAHVVHVWHMFYPQLTEARDAWDEIEKFIARCGRVSNGGCRMRHRTGNFRGARGHVGVLSVLGTARARPRPCFCWFTELASTAPATRMWRLYFTQRDYTVVALDHPNHGKSDGSYGHVDSFDDFVQTLDIFHQQVSAEFSGLPQFLLGHSMGGLISCLYLLQQQSAFVGCVLSGPAIKTDIEPGLLQMLLIRVLSKVAPKAGVLALDANGVSRDPAEVDKYVNDPLVNHDKMTARKVAELFRGMQQFKSSAGEIKLPMLLLHGEADRHGSGLGLAAFCTMQYQLRSTRP